MASYHSNGYSIHVCACVWERQNCSHLNLLWDCPIVTFHCSSSFVHLSNNVNNIPFVYEHSIHGKLLPPRRMSCLKYFTHWSSAAQVHGLELQPGISETPEWCAGSVLPCFSAAILHGFSPQGTGSHGNWDWRSQMCKFITKSISLRMTHSILAPCKWKNAFGAAFDSYPTVLRIRAAWKAPSQPNECKAIKIFWILPLSVDDNSLFHFITCGKITHIHTHEKTPTATTKETAWSTHFLWCLFFSLKPVLKT